MPEPPSEDRQDASRRHRAAWFVLFTILATLAVMLAVEHLLPRLGDPDARRLAFERTWRWGVYHAGFLLPGTPPLDRRDERLAERGFKPGAPVFIRVFKEDFELELWLQRGDRFELFATYPICRFSGELGPKLRQGDRQAPEGVYTVARSQLNPASRWHRSFNLGFPNALDRSHARTGSYLMVHGGCSSVGCYAMTNAVVDEIWALVTGALGGGQNRFQVQVFPFRLTEAAIAARQGHRWAGFWRDLKPAYDLFEATRIPPQVGTCKGRYTFAPGATGSTGSRLLTKNCFSQPALATN